MERRWYIVHTMPGQERKVAQDILHRAEISGMAHLITRTLVPERSYFVVQRGRRRERREAVYPGYVYVEMVLDERTWYLVRSTPGVLGFVGQGDPVPVSDEEMERIFRIMKLSRGDVAIRPGDRVQVISGPFMFRKGRVLSVDDRQRKARVELEAFGRTLAVEIACDDLEPVPAERVVSS